MLSKLVLFACLLTMVSCQTISTCYAGNFTFWSNYNDSESISEFEWDWYGQYFYDGTNDAFDNYFLTAIAINGEFHNINTSIPVDFDCDVGSTDVNSFSVATYTYNITSKVQIRRQFYAPRKVAMMRIVDEIINHGSEAATFSTQYNGEYGSDEDTTWQEVTDYYWVSYENDGSDPPLSLNAGSIGGLVGVPVKGVGQFFDGVDTTSWGFYDFVIPAGESRSLMTIIAMHRTIEDASELAHSLNTMPPAIYDNFPTPLDSVLNWGLCTIVIEQLVPQMTFCSIPASTTFKVTGAEASISFNGSPVTLSNNNTQFSVTLAAGENKIQYLRSADACSTLTVNLDLKVPTANLTFSVDTSGDLPSVSAAGGFGEYEYTWKFGGGGNLNEAFGAKATAMITDKEGCTASVDLDVPELLVSVPVSVPSGKVSSAAQAIPLFTLVGLVMAL